MNEGRVNVIPLDQLFVDHSYHQQASARHVERLANQWSDDLAGFLLVVERGPGNYSIVDGVHRYEAAQRAGIEQLPCIVVEASTLEDEARLWLEQRRPRFLRRRRPRTR